MRPATRTLVACVVLSSVLGTIHAFSLFIGPFEDGLDAGRGAVSSVYSLALVALTLAVLTGHPLFRRVPAPLIALGAAGGAAAGLVLAASASSLTILIVGYGLVFGTSNGIGYAFSLQQGAEANPDRRGMAIGLVTAAYALGAAMGALFLDARIEAAGAQSAMRSLAVVIVGAGVLSALLLATGARVVPTPDQPPVARPLIGIGRVTLAGPTTLDMRLDRRLIARLWGAYGLATLAGLMALGHAAAIAEEAGGSEELGVTTVVVAGIASAGGGTWIAFTIDRARLSRLLVGLPVASALALCIVATADNGNTALFGLALVALVYGAVIAAYPFAVNRLFGDHRYPAAYGRIFTAWGLAGLLGPLGAGTIFDASGGYTIPLLLAAVAALGSATVSRRIPQLQQPRIP